VFRFYQVVVSTSWAALHDRDVAEILGRAFGGVAGATAGAAGDALAAATRAAEREARRYEARRERQLAQELDAERRRTEREQRATEHHRERADARWAAQFREGGAWMYVRHGNTAHPHVHVVAVTDGRGLHVDDLNRMRAHVVEREQQREREQGHERLRQHDRGYGLGD
jgi:ribosomal protein L12E/L44/L45/RPP1/RPP2